MSNEIPLQINGVLFKDFFYTYRSLKCTHCPIAEPAGRIYCKTTIFLFLWLSLWVFLIATQSLNKIKQYQIDKNGILVSKNFVLYCSLYLLFNQEHVLFEMVYLYLI